VRKKATDALNESEKYLHLKALIAVGVEQAERGEVVEYNEEFRKEALASTIRRAAAGEEPNPDVCP
jgi:hypothetical protein